MAKTDIHRWEIFLADDRVNVTKVIGYITLNGFHIIQNVISLLDHRQDVSSSFHDHSKIRRKKINKSISQKKLLAMADKRDRKHTGSTTVFSFTDYLDVYIVPTTTKQGRSSAVISKE